MRMNGTHDSDRGEDEAGVEEGVKRNEGGRQVERHGALKPRSPLAKDGNLSGECSRRARGATVGRKKVRAIARAHGKMVGWRSVVGCGKEGLRATAK